MRYTSARPRRRTTIGAALAVAVGLLASTVVAAPATAAEKDVTSPLAMSITIDSPRPTFKAGEKLTTVFTAKNTTGKSVKLPKDAVLVMATATAGDGADAMKGGCNVVGAGGYPYTWVDYGLELPSTVASGKSFTCTYTHVATKADVANGGIYGYFQYGTDGFYGESWSNTFQVFLHAADGKKTISFSGEPTVGRPVTAKLGYWAQWTGKASYQWFADNKKIEKATSATYTPTAGDRGKRLTVQVTRLDEYGGWVTMTSDPTKPVAAGTLTSATPTITGTAKVGSKLTAKPGTWTSGTKLTYQWYADGKTISKATSSTYTPTKTVAGKKLTVKVTGTKAGYTTVTKASAPTKAVAR